MKRLVLGPVISVAKLCFTSTGWNLNGVLVANGARKQHPSVIRSLFINTKVYSRAAHAPDAITEGLSEQSVELGQFALIFHVHVCRGNSAGGHMNCRPTFRALEPSITLSKTLRASGRQTIMDAWGAW